MHPKQTNPTKQERTARAPYNFIPLPEKVVPAEQPLPDHDVYREDLNTGYIDCTLTTESPLYTRCALNPDFFRQYQDKQFHELNEEQKNVCARFFSIDDARRPVIPGSSLRGMVRALVEIASHGKMQWVSDEHLVFRAVGDTSSLGEKYRSQLMQEIKRDHLVFLMKAGYMHKKNNDWYIIPAKEDNGVNFGRIESNDIPRGLQLWHECRNAWTIYAELNAVKSHPHNKKRHPIFLSYAKVNRAATQQEPGLNKMVLVETGTISRKHLHFVFGLPDTDKKTSHLHIPEEMLFAYRNQITQGQELLLGKDGILREMQPIFYLVEDGKLVFLGHTMMFRLPYPNKVKDFVPESLRCDSGIDLTEAIFGFTSREGYKGYKGGYAGRVFFTDARYISSKEGVWYREAPIRPKVLAAPKPTCFQHYLVQDKDQGHNPDEKKSLAHYGTPPVKETVIRGYKLYWHKDKNPTIEIEKDAEVKESQLTRIKPVKPGVTFRFRVYFENLGKAELGALLWVLQLPGDCRHKLGMGKPLGMGAVKITPELFLADRKKRYSKLFEGDGWFEATERQETEQFTNAFEYYMLDWLKEQTGPEQKFQDIDRIKMLLAMLKWPGPDPSLTRYMRITGGDNEYKERPVLPDPLSISNSINTGFQQQSTQAARPQPLERDTANKHTRQKDTRTTNTALAEAFKKAEKNKVKNVKNVR